MSNILKPHEIENLIPLAKAFIAESGEDIPFDPDHFKETWEQILASDAGAIIKYEKDGKIIGALGFLVYKDILSGELKSTETFWFVSKEFRGVGLLLFDEFERISKERGVKRIMMAHLSKLTPERLKTLYLKKGYREVETYYERSI